MLGTRSPCLLMALLETEACMVPGMQVLQRYQRVAIPRPGMELEFLPGQDLQPMHYRRSVTLLLLAWQRRPCQHVAGISVPFSGRQLHKLKAASAAAQTASGC